MISKLCIDICDGMEQKLIGFLGLYRNKRAAVIVSYNTVPTVLKGRYYAD